MKYSRINFPDVSYTLKSAVPVQLSEDRVFNDQLTRDQLTRDQLTKDKMTRDQLGTGGLRGEELANCELNDP